MLSRRGGHFPARPWYRPWALGVTFALVVGVVGAATAGVRDRGRDGNTRLSVVTSSTAVTSTTVEPMTTTTSATPTLGRVSGSGPSVAGRSTVATPPRRVTAATPAPTPPHITTTTKPNQIRLCQPTCPPEDDEPDDD